MKIKLTDYQIEQFAPMVELVIKANRAHERGAIIAQPMVTVGNGDYGFIRVTFLPPRLASELNEWFKQNRQEITEANQ